MAPATKPALSTELVVLTALKIADAEGIDALSMRRVGTELGVAAMSLYNHVADKDELLSLMVDHVFGTVGDIDAAAPWQSGVAGFFADLHAALLAHPAAAQVATLQPTQGLHTQRHSRQVIDVLLTGLDEAFAVEAFVALSCFTLGSVLYTAARAGHAVTDPRWVTFGAPCDEAPAQRASLARRAERDRFRSGLDHLIRGYATEAAPLAD